MQKLHAKVTYESWIKVTCESYIGFWRKSYTKLDKSYIKLPAFENLKAGFLYLGMKVTYNSSYFTHIRPQDKF